MSPQEWKRSETKKDLRAIFEFAATHVLFVGFLSALYLVVHLWMEFAAKAEPILAGLR